MEHNKWFDYDHQARIDDEVDKRLQEWENTAPWPEYWEVADKRQELQRTVSAEQNMKSIVDALRDLQERVRALEQDRDSSAE